MIRVAHVADTHSDERSRFDEHQRVMAFIAEQIRERDVDLVLHAGDAHERAETTPAERAAVRDWAQEVARHAPLVIVRGNHDGEGDIEWLGRLRTEHPVFAMTRPGVWPVVVRHGNAPRQALVACLPWPRRSALAASAGDMAREQMNEAAQRALRSVLSGMGNELRCYTPGALPCIFLGHVDLSGAVTDQDQPMVNGDMSLTLADLALVGADYYALGHIHAAQRFEIDGAPVVYPGAPRHCNWGEPAPGKGFVIASFDRVNGRWRCVDVEHVETPCRPMLLIDDEWKVDGDQSGFTRWACNDWDYRGAEVRFRYSVQADRRDAARAEAGKVAFTLEEYDAASVKVEERVVATSRARVPEVATLPTVFEQLEAKWRADGVKLSAERRTRLMAKVEQLEAEQ